MLQHVALEVRPEQAEACAAFYALLGFVEVPTPETLSDRVRWLQRSGDQIHLLYSDAPAPPSGHFAVVVGDYEATTRAVREAGHEVDPRFEHWGSPRAYLRDPAGHRVEVMAYAPGARP